MTTDERRRTAELVHAADMAVRTASQLHLWTQRGTLSDRDCLLHAVQFLDEAVKGGRFVATGDSPSQASSLNPLTWSADVHFRQFSPASQAVSPAEYQQLVDRLAGIRGVLQDVLEDRCPTAESVAPIVDFFSQLGRLLGDQADAALRSPISGIELLYDHFSYQ